jgi:hypothetical protein
MLCDSPKGIAFWKVPGFALCPFGNSNVLTQMSTEHRWNEVDWGKPKHQEKNLPQRPPQISYGLTGSKPGTPRWNNGDWTNKQWHSTMWRRRSAWLSLKNQFVPRRKHIPSRLQKTNQLMLYRIIMTVLRTIPNTWMNCADKTPEFWTLNWWYI